MKLSFFGAPCALLILAGCGSSSSGYKPVPEKPKAVATVKAGEEATLFPITVGNKWQYTVTTKLQNPRGQVTSNSTDISMEVKSSEGGVAMLDISKGDVVQDSQKWSVTPQGIFQNTIGIAPDVRTYEPAQPVVSFPLEVDKEVVWEGKGPTGVSDKGVNLLLPIHQVLVCRGVEDVDTYMGDMSAYRIETTQTYSFKNKDGQMINVTDKSYSWWAPKIGMVRYKKELTTTLGSGDPGVSQTQLIMLRQFTVK